MVRKGPRNGQCRATEGQRNSQFGARGASMMVNELPRKGLRRVKTGAKEGSRDGHGWVKEGSLTSRRGQGRVKGWQHKDQ